MSTAPSLEEIRASSSHTCTSKTLAHLMGVCEEKEDVILVDRKPEIQKTQERDDNLSEQYANQFQMNCFYQFRRLRDTKKSFFGIDDDDNAVAGPVNETQE